jgi:hypothetical protein
MMFYAFFDVWCQIKRWIDIFNINHAILRVSAVGRTVKVCGQYCLIIKIFCCLYRYIYIYIYYIYIYIYCTVLKRLASPSDFHIPLPSTVPFVHSETSFTHCCVYLIFPGSSGTTSFFPSFRFPVGHNFCQLHWVLSRNMSIPNEFFQVMSTNLARPFFL